MDPDCRFCSRREHADTCPVYLATLREVLIRRCDSTAAALERAVVELEACRARVANALGAASDAAAIAAHGMREIARRLERPLSELEADLVAQWESVVERASREVAA